MFEYTFMNQAATVRTLRQRITEMQPLHLDERALPTAAELSGLLPGGALRAGTSITVQGSLQLSLALIAAASASGAWCGAIGVPEIGFEAAAALGLALERFVVVPEPGTHGLSIAATLSEVLTAIVLRPVGQVGPSEASRVTAKLRDRGTALIVLGSWPGAECRLQITASRWTGLGEGHGLLDARELRVQSQDHRGRREHTVRFTGGRLA